MRSVPKCAEVCQIRAEIAAKICPKFCAENPAPLRTDQLVKITFHNPKENQP